MRIMNDCHSFGLRCTTSKTPTTSSVLSQARGLSPVTASPLFHPCLWGLGGEKPQHGLNSLNPWRKQRSCWTWACGVLQAKKKYLGTVFLKELPFSKDLCLAEHFLSKLALGYMHFSQWKKNLLPVMLEVHSPSKGTSSSNCLTPIWV